MPIIKKWSKAPSSLQPWWLINIASAKVGIDKKIMLAISTLNLNASECRVEDLESLTQVESTRQDFPLASDVVRGIPVYDCQALSAALETGHLDKNLQMSEWVQVWKSGPGVLVLQGAFKNLDVIDAATKEFQQMIQTGRQAGTGADHFAKPGANDRVWNALEKLCLLAPKTFSEYYSNPMLALACTAWLGPAYQMTSQVNCVNPGGEAQKAHRDYHLGFLTAEQAQSYPTHVHAFSPFLTLQGAIAHVDMPLESGPTLYLPHSQKYLPGYLTAGNASFQAFFDTHRVQLPMKKGDAVFFNPALMHAAGSNRSVDQYRLANLLQVSSAFGRPMESVDRQRMARALYPTLLAMQSAAELDTEQLACVVAASAEGYAFPTSLDSDPPLGGLSPENQQSLMLRALHERWPVHKFNHTLQTQAEKKLA
jgi:ectoine hydroxylase-related dioxygenase (phytanoyl-CoA dioxygenase family)